MATASAELGGKLDILVNNAGQTFFGAATACTAEEYARLMATNLESCFHLAQLAHPLLLAGSGGNVVNVSSIGGLLGYPMLSLYSATKAALNQLTRTLAVEWACDGVRVNCVAPGPPRQQRHSDGFRGGTEDVGGGERAHRFGPPRRAGGGRIACRVPLHAGCFVHHRADHLRRWRPYRSRLGLWSRSVKLVLHP